MFYKLIAILIVISVILAPIGVIVYFTFNYSPWILAFSLLHFWLLGKFFGLVKKLNASFEDAPVRSGGNEKIGGKEKIVAVIDSGKKKKKI